MKIYMDDDSASALLIRLLRAEGHDVVTPGQVGTGGAKDPTHLLHALQEGRALLTRNHHDFALLHELVVGSGGHHHGVLIERRDNDPTRDLNEKQLVRALRKLIGAGVPIADELHVLNQWR